MRLANHLVFRFLELKAMEAYAYRRCVRLDPRSVSSKLWSSTVSHASQERGKRRDQVMITEPTQSCESRLAEIREEGGVTKADMY